MGPGDPAQPEVASPTQPPPEVASHWQLPPGWGRPARPARSAGTRARVLTGLLSLNILVSIVDWLVSLWGWMLLDAYKSDGATVDDLDLFDRVNAGVGLLGVIALICAAIAWLAWQSRTIDNEAPLGIGPSPWSPRLAMLWWFVPFANLVMPYRIHADIDRRYREAAGADRLVLTWWLLYLIDSIVGNAAGRLWGSADTIETLQFALLVFVASDVLGIAAATTAIRMIRRIQARADALLSACPATPGAPRPESAGAVI